MDWTLRRFVFLVPPFQLELGSSRRKGLRLRGTNLRGGAQVDFCNAQAEHYVRLLKNQQETIICADNDDLAPGVVYAVINKEECHWLAVEVCIRLKEALIYDPQVRRPKGSEHDPSHYFMKLRSVLEMICIQK